MKHSNVAIFVPHNGCPHQCSFCNQKSIVGQAYQPTAKDVVEAIEVASNSLKENSLNAEIAFFGGSFTAIDREYMVSLLDATTPYIDKFKGIRISTRPDCIDEEVLSLLKQYNVTSIELGAQSMDDDVLKANNRGHSAKDVINASKLIKSYSFSLGLQMMTGLYKSTVNKDIYTAQQFIALKPDTVRIYPTVVMLNTELERLFQEGMYIPLGVDESVDLCAQLLTMFDKADIPVIRLGLHHSESLEKDMITGAYHPAFRELCESKLMLYKALKLLENKDTHSFYEISVSPSCVSKMIGNNKGNIKQLNELGYKIKIVQDINVPFMEVFLNKTEG
ncbi:MAG: radical SAM protein [Ruminococcus sp.]|nr:radical SAM protein [Ruminococcus sp.]